METRGQLCHAFSAPTARKMPRRADRSRCHLSGGVPQLRPGFSYFFTKERQSVHWSIDGFVSCVPTRILSNEQ